MDNSKNPNTRTSRLKKFLANADAGATMIEYAIMVAFIAAVMFTIVQTLGKVTQSLIAVGAAF